MGPSYAFDDTIYGILWACASILSCRLLVSIMQYYIVHIFVAQYLTNQSKSIYNSAGTFLQSAKIDSTFVECQR